MKRLYNNYLGTREVLKNAQKLGLLVLATVLPMAGVSCRKAATATKDPAAAARPAAAAIAEADQCFAGRNDLVKVREGIVILRQAQADDQVNYDLAWRLAKFNYYLGDHSPNADERDKSFHDGIEAGRQAIKLENGKPDGHFWLGANYGGSAKASVLSGLSDFDDIKSEMETVIKLDEGYQNGSAYMALGRLYLEAPGIMGGDTQKAIEYLEKGLKLGPDNALLRAQLAAAYVAAHRNEEARKQIDAVLAMKPAPGLEPEYNDAVAQVQKLQEKIK